MRRHGVNITCSDVRLDLVLVQSSARRSMVNGIKQRKQFTAPIAVAEQSKCDHRPDGAVRILPAVFTHARRIALDITRIELSLIERRSEKQYQSIAATDQIFVHRCHSANSAMRFSRARDDTPGLCDGINAALVILRRAQRCSVIKIGATIPIAIPGVLIQSSPQLFHMILVALNELSLISLFAERYEARQRGVQEPTQPYTFSFAQV